jgi:YfiR/HmsC-like
LKNHFVTEKEGDAPRRCPSWQTAAALFSLLFAFAFSGHAQSAPTENQLEAAFVYNFVKYVDWPASAFTNESSPYVIGVLGDDAFGNDLKNTITGKTINGRELVFKSFHSARDIDNCQVLFIGKSEKSRFKEILGILHGKSILTISSEADNFIDNGGIINFVLMPDQTIRFQINNAAAKAVGLSISSDLLNLALPAQ